MVQFYIDKDRRNNPNNLRNGAKLNQVLRVYHIAHSEEEFAPSVKSADTSRVERYLVPEQWVNKFAHDPLGANGDLEILKRNNIEYDILRFNCQFLKKPLLEKNIFMFSSSIFSITSILVK